MRDLKPERILVIMLGGIGNMILLLPALEGLRQRFSEARIDLLAGEPNVDAICAAHRVVDYVHVLDRRYRMNIFKTMQTIRQIAKQNYDIAIVSSGTNKMKSDLLISFAGISHKIAEEHKMHIHETDGNLTLVSDLGVSVESPLPRLRIYDEDHQAAQNFLSQKEIQNNDFLLGMHTGSGFRQTFKRWDPKKFAMLADQCIEQWQAKVVLTGSTQEKELVEEIIELMKHDAISAAGALSIRETAGLVQRCQLFVSNDSGIAHIAAAMKTPVIVLFGETEIERIAPRGENVHIVRAPVKQNLGQALTVNLIEVHRVFEKVKELVGES